jgi:cytochrome c-type biogenesis protein CcmH/NrfG
MRFSMPIVSLFSLFTLLSVFFAADVRANADPANEDWAGLAAGLKERLVTEPTNAELFNQYGYFAYRAGEDAPAQKAYENALALRPAFPVAWNNLGVLHLRAERFVEAETCFRAALKHDPDYSKARYNLAVSRFRQGAFREAFFMYWNLRRADPFYTELRTNPAKAEEELEAALRANPNDPFLKAMKKRLQNQKGEAGYAWD